MADLDGTPGVGGPQMGSNPLRQPHYCYSHRDRNEVSSCILCICTDQLVPSLPLVCYTHSDLASRITCILATAMIKSIKHPGYPWYLAAARFFFATCTRSGMQRPDLTATWALPCGRCHSSHSTWMTDSATTAPYYRYARWQYSSLTPVSST